MFKTIVIIAITALIFTIAVTQRITISKILRNRHKY